MQGRCSLILIKFPRKRPIMVPICHTTRASLTMVQVVFPNMHLTSPSYRRLARQRHRLLHITRFDKDSLSYFPRPKCFSRPSFHRPSRWPAQLPHDHRRQSSLTQDHLTAQLCHPHLRIGVFGRLLSRTRHQAHRFFQGESHPTWIIDPAVPFLAPRMETKLLLKRRNLSCS